MSRKAYPPRPPYSTVIPAGTPADVTATASVLLVILLDPSRTLWASRAAAATLVALSRHDNLTVADLLAGLNTRRRRGGRGK